MLEVYIYAHGTRVEEAVPSGMELIRDPEAYFSCLELRCDDIDRDLVRVIEEGTLLDGSRFLDRFGVTLYTQQLSTGCKAALMVNNSDTINRFLCASHDAFVGRFIGDCEVDKLIPLYSLSADEYARAYKKYKLKKFPGSISPVNLIERI